MLAVTALTPQAMNTTRLITVIRGESITNNLTRAVVIICTPSTRIILTTQAIKTTRDIPTTLIPSALTEVSSIQTATIGPI